MAKTSALTKKKKIGYGFGILTESLIYNMFYTYYLTFLIQYIGIKPALAGVVIYISIAWDAVTDPLIGNYTDRQGVDKRRVMAKAIVPLGICFVVAWSTLGNSLFGTSQALKIIFYTIITMCIWVFYTFYTIPYYAVVAEITEDYDERTDIRSTSSLINAGAVGLANILPALVGMTIGITITFMVIAGVISIIACIAGFVCVVSLRGLVLAKAVNEHSDVVQRTTMRDTVRSFGQVLKLKPFAIFLIFVFFYLACSSMIQSNLTYMIIDCIKMKYDTGIAIVIISLVVTMAITVPFVTKLAEKKDRKTALLVFFCIMLVGLIACKLIGLDAVIGKFKFMAIMMPAVLGIGTGSFWTLFYSMAYDLVELDEFTYGTRRESIITAFPQLIQKLGSATGILGAGIALTAYGYNSDNDVAGKEAGIKAIQDAKVVNGMENISTLIPACLLVVSIVFLLVYPMTRERIGKLVTQLENKRQGKEYNTDGFEKLL